MILLLIRHGNASRQSPDYCLHLTARGKVEVNKTALYLKNKNIALKAIWHSPKPRTAETAKMIFEKLGRSSIDLEEKMQLVPDGETQAIYNDLVAEKPDVLALVSHQPFLERFSDLLLADMEEPPKLKFPTAGVQAFEWNREWNWLWSFDPSQPV